MTMPKKGKKAEPELFLRKKLIQFQREIVELKRINKEQGETIEQREHKLLFGLLEILDAFDTLEQNIQGKEKRLEKTGQRFVKSTRAVHRKLLRLLQSCHVEPLEFPDNKAKIEHCKVLATQNDPARENEEIISQEKKGYIHTERQQVLRKAEVITVYNEGPPMKSVFSSQNHNNS